MTLAALLAACAGDGARQEARPAAAVPAASRLADRTAAAGIDFVHLNGMRGEFHVAELVGAGAALVDYDGDGDLDAYLVQGGPLEPPRDGSAGGDRLLRNDGGPGGPRFVDVSERAGVLGGGPGAGHGMGIASGDYDGDGWIDLYRTAYGPNQLLRNRGDGGFEETTVTAAAADDRWSVPATFFDFDRDGRLDLFVGNYLDYRHAEAPPCVAPSGRRDWCGAARFPGVEDRLLRNRGGWRGGPARFEEATASAGLAPAASGRALGAVAVDLDGDGWQDLYVGNDAGPNHLWRNRGGGGRPGFEEDGLLAGAALNAEGRPEASMGIAVADYDRDGDPDLALGHLVVETNTLYRNRGGGLFEDRSDASDLGPPSRIHTAFGLLFLDTDGDGWLDLFAANGAVQNIESLASRGDPFPVHEINQLFRSRGPIGGEVRYREATAAAGDAFTRSEVSRGAAGGDVESDGDTDILLSNNNGPARLLLDERPAGRWLGLRLLTGASGRDALGAAVQLESGAAAPRWGRVATDGSYASASDPRLLFTLAAGEPAVAIAVRWPDGRRQRYASPPVGRYATLAQRPAPPAGVGGR